MNEPTHDRIDPESTPLPVGTRRGSIQTGAYELIPIPFVDAWLIRKRRREMVAALLEGRGIRIERKALDILAGKPRSLGARVIGLIRGLVIRPLRKILRTVLFWLSVRRAFVTTVESYLLLRYLSHPAADRIMIDGTIDEAAAATLADGFKKVSRRIDGKVAASVVRRLWRKSSDRGELRGAKLEQAMRMDAPGFLERFDREVAGVLDDERQH